MIRNAGADCGSGAGADVTICGRADASAPFRDKVGARIGEDCIDDMVEEETVAAGADRDGAALPDITGDPPPFCSSIRIASSGVGMSAT